jgi:hypothetical protein
VNFLYTLRSLIESRTAAIAPVLSASTTIGRKGKDSAHSDESIAGTGTRREHLLQALHDAETAVVRDQSDARAHARRGLAQHHLSDGWHAASTKSLDASLRCEPADGRRLRQFRSALADSGTLNANIVPASRIRLHSGLRAESGMCSAQLVTASSRASSRRGGQ